MELEPKGKKGIYIQKIIEAFAVAGWAAVMIMMVWGTLDVVLLPFGYAVPATVPWTEIFNVIALALPLTYVASKKSHVDVSLFTFRGRAKRLADFFSGTLFFLFAALLAWQLSIQAWRSVRIGEFDQLGIKIYWFPAKIALALGFIGTAIVVMFQLIGQFGKRNGK